MAVIRINDLKLRAIIGAHSWERKQRQDVIINLAITYDYTKAAQSDCLKDALDYEALATLVSKVVESSKHVLLEKLASQIMKILLENPKIRSAWVKIDKPQAIAAAKSVSLELYGDNS